MAIKRKKVESFILDLTTEEDFIFEDILLSDRIKQSNIRVRDKKVSLKILENSDDYIVGLVVTSREDNIPPKIDKDKEIKPLNLDDGDGLAYGNVFIYERQRNILMYEVNKFGCYINHFIDFIFLSLKDDDTYFDFDLSLNPLLNANSYRRMINMSFHKSLEVKFASPSRLLEEYRHRNDAIWNSLKSGSDIQSEKVQTKFEVMARGSSNGLASQPVRTLVDRIFELVRSPFGEKVEKIEVVGYETDSEDDRLVTLNLKKDLYIKYIQLDEPQAYEDLLERQRKELIRTLYFECLSDFNEILG